MRPLLFLLLLCGCFPFVAAQQTKGVQLYDTHPLVGCWQYTGNSSENATLFDEDETKYIWFSCCGKESFSSILYWSDEGFGGISTFVPYVDGKKLYIKLKSCVAVMLSGLEVELSYKVSGDRKTLTLSRNSKKYVYKQVMPSELKSDE